jgi:hypothetical protein
MKFNTKGSVVAITLIEILVVIAVIGTTTWMSATFIKYNQPLGYIQPLKH